MNLDPKENIVSHYFHCFPIYLPWSDGTSCHDLSFWKLSFKPPNISPCTSLSCQASLFVHAKHKISGHQFPTWLSCLHYTVPPPQCWSLRPSHMPTGFPQCPEWLAYMTRVLAGYSMTVFLDWTLVLLRLYCPQAPWGEAARSLPLPERLEKGNNISFSHHHHISPCKHLCSLLANDNSLCPTSHCGSVVTSLDRALAKKLKLVRVGGV